MELKMIGEQGAAGTHQAADAVFGRDFNQALVHQLVVAYQANARIGSRAQKDRGAVAHSTKKPWRFLSATKVPFSDTTGASTTVISRSAAYFFGAVI